MKTFIFNKSFVSSVLVLGCLAWPAAAEFTIPPHLQHPGTTTMTVMWESDTLEEAAVTLRQEAQEPRIVTATKPVTVTFHEPWNDTSSPEKTRYIYSVKLTGLRPGTRYTYLAKMGAIDSESSVFQTFPERADTFTFIAYGDSRSGVGTHKKLAANFAQYDPAFILHSGDMVDEPRASAHWRSEFFEPLAGVINRIPIFGARGNHEGDGKNMDLYLSPPDGMFGYSFDYGTAHVVCLDMSDKAEDIGWADKDLASTKATWRFAFNHFPSFNIGGHASSWGRDTVVPMFRKRGIDLAFSGDSHIYERFFPLVPLNEPDLHPVTYVVSGGGGAPSYGTAPNPCLAMSASKPHFLVVKVAGDTMTVEARDIDNALFDSFTIRKRNGTYDKEYLASVMPEEVVTLHNALARRRLMRVAASAVPGLTDPADVTCSYSGPRVDLAATLTMSLDEESQGAYITEPAVWEPKIMSGEKEEFTFKVRARQKVTFGDGKAGPPLVFACRYKVGKVEGKVTYGVDLEKALHLDPAWQPLGSPPPEERIWRFTSFDPVLEKDKRGSYDKQRFREVTLPKELNGWFNPEYDDSAWQSGKAPIGRGTWTGNQNTYKNNSDWGDGEFLVLRTTFDVDSDHDYYRLSVLARNGYSIYLNGHKIHSYGWWTDIAQYRQILLTEKETKQLKKGRNVLAVIAYKEYPSTIGPNDNRWKTVPELGVIDCHIEGLGKSGLEGK